MFDKRNKTRYSESNTFFELKQLQEKYNAS
jgi:hypothetical protein